MEQDRTFKINNVQFELPVIPPLRGWEICELFREAVGRPEVLMSLTSDSAASPEQAGKRIIMGLLVSMSREHVAQIRNELFGFVRFKTPDQPKFMELQGLEDMCFQNLDPFAVYEVMGRCFTANFTAYFNEMLNRFGISASAMAEQAKEADSDTAP